MSNLFCHITYSAQLGHSPEASDPPVQFGSVEIQWNDLRVMYNTYTQTQARTHRRTHTRTQAVSHDYRLRAGNSQARHCRLRDINQQLSVCSHGGVLYAYCSRQVIY